MRFNGNMASSRAIAIAAVTAALCIGAPARAADEAAAAAEQADGTIRDIVVTADRTGRTMQKTPIAMSAVSGDEITRLGRTRMEDMLQNLPSVVVAGFARGQLISIRGLGSDLPPQLGQSAVSQNYDGVYNFRSESNAVGFYDLNRVEVLRGPQGTLYGRNATGGVVNVISNDPDFTGINGYVTGEVGNYGLLHAEAAANVPLGDQVAARISGATINRNGFLSNGHDDNVSSSGRVKILFQPTSDLSILLGGEYSKLGGKGFGFAQFSRYAAGDYWGTGDTGIGYLDFWSYKVWANINAKIGPGTLTILPSLQRAGEVHFGAFGGVTQYGNDPKEALQHSIEMRYASNPGAPFQWSVGFYHYDSKNVSETISVPCTDLSGAVLIPPDGYSYDAPGPGPFCRATPAPIYAFPGVAKTSTDAGFAQVTVPLGNRFRIIGGIRYTHDFASSKQGSNAGFGGDLTIPGTLIYDEISENYVQYRGGFEFDAAPGVLVFGTVANGRRAGGFNFDNSPFGSERLTDYEVGIKSRWLDGRLQVNANAFYYDYHDYQLAQLSVNSLGVFTVVFTNLPTAREYGAELETTAQITRHDLLNFSVVYLNSRLTSTDPTLLDLNQLPPVPANFAGSHFSHAPEWTLKGSYSHVFEFNGGSSLIPRVDARHLSSQNVKSLAVNATQGEYNEVHQGAYTIVDLSLLFDSGNNWSVTGYVKNLTNEPVKTGDYVGYVSVLPPRTFGVIGTIKF